MIYNIYLDESGNTGNIELREDMQWNYGNQPYFALGSFYIEESIANDIKQCILEILHKYNPKLGIEDELKSKAKYIFKNDLMEEVTKVLCDNKVGFYFDIANKKYKVIMNMVEYCVYPYFVKQSYIFARNEKVNAANFLYKTLPKEKIKIYIDLCQEVCDEEDKITQLIAFLEMLEEHFRTHKEKVNPIKLVAEVVGNYKEHGLKIEHLFPVKDFNNKGAKESFLPNVDAYNNIIGSIGNLKLNQYDEINIYHDEQKQFSNVLESWTSYMKVYGINISKLNFCVSHDDVLVQIADFYTGNILRLYRKIVEYISLNRAERELIKIIKPLLANCNIVAPDNEQREFFDKCELKMRRTPIPFL